MEGQGWALLIELIAVLAAAFLLGTLMERFRQSAVLGYVLAGVLLGPGVSGFVKEIGTVHDLSELGIGLVLFTIGLEFSWRELRKLGRIAIGGGALQIFFTWFAFFLLASTFIADRKEALAVGAIAALSSTVIVLRALKERGDLDAPHGKACFGILLVQDIALIPIVFLFTLLASKPKFKAPNWEDFSGTFAVVVLIVLAFLIGALVVLPRLLSSRAMARNRELPILLAVTACIGAAWAAYNIGISPALGAFVAGLLLAETGYAAQLRADVAPLRALFATLFFASIGMLADVHWAGSHIGWVLLCTAVLIACKAALSGLAVRLLGMTAPGAAATGICLAQVGELSFVLLQLCIGLSLIEAETSQLVTSVAVFSLIACPYLVAGAPSIGRWAAKHVFLQPMQSLEEERGRKSASELRGHVVVAGFGEAGRSACKFLVEQDVQVLVLETDRRMVHLARTKGFHSFVGDATQTENLEHARLKDAAGFVVALSDHRSVALVTAIARHYAPDVPIVARARYHLFHEEIGAAGAEVVVDEEGLVGKLLGEEMARQLGIGNGSEESPN